MALDVLLVAFAVVFPGAISIRVWDFVARISDRSRESLFGLGAFFGCVPYVALQILGLVDLKTLFNADGRINLNVILATRNLVLFVSASSALAAAAWLMSRLAHSDLGERLASMAWGRTLGGSNWTDVASDALGRWVNLRTKDGQEWFGYLETIPDNDVGHMRLRWPEYHDAENDQWLGGNDAVVLPVKDLRYLLILKEVKDGNGEDRQQKGDSGRQQTGEQQGETAGGTIVTATHADEPNLAAGSVSDAASAEAKTS
jgi:hypothetical protein